MSIIFTEGFDAYGSNPTASNLDTYLSRKWQTIFDPGPAMALVTGRVDGRANHEADSGSGDADRYSIDPVGTGQVHAVVLNSVCRETDASPFDITLHANGDGAAQAIGSTSYVMRSEIFEVNPDTSNPWTPSEVNSIEVGFNIT